MQFICSSAAWYVPGMQSKQVVLPGFAWWRPAVHFAHPSLLANVEDALPTAHFTQPVCSLFDWYFPGMQFKQPVVPFPRW
jgi:hypothetical protein